MDLNAIFSKNDLELAVEVYKLPSGCFNATLFAINVNGQTISFVRNQSPNQVIPVKLDRIPGKRFVIRGVGKDRVYQTLRELVTVYDSPESTSEKLTNLTFATDFLLDLQQPIDAVQRAYSRLGQRGAQYGSYEQYVYEHGYSQRIAPLRDGNFAISFDESSSEESMDALLSRPLLKQTRKPQTTTRTGRIGQFTTDQDQE